MTEQLPEKAAEQLAEQRVSVAIEDGVADVRLARPEKMNALDSAMFDALIDTGKQLAKDKSLRSAVLSGEGRAFCAGLDFGSFMAMAEKPSGPTLFHRDEKETANRAQSAAWVWNELPVPVIAAVHGVCFGGGLQIALAADIRFVTPDVRMSVMEIRWGLVPDMSGTQTLRHFVRQDIAKELAYTGREVGGEEAVALGLATHVVDSPYAAATAMAREIAGKSPSAIRGTKRLLARAYTADPVEGLRLEEGIQKSLIGKPNQIEAVTANLEKRPPNFQDVD